MKYVIIGGSAAGISGAEAIREMDKTGDITVISDESFALYSRCLITYYLAGAMKEEQLKFRADDFFKKNNMNALLGVRVKKVVPETRKIQFTDGKELPFDKLLVATGSSPKKLGIPGEEKKGVFGVRTIEDARGIDRMLDKVDTVVVLEGGLIGMRDAYALNKRGKKVKVIIKSNRILSQMLDEGAAAILRKIIEKNGIEIMTGLDGTEIYGDEHVKGIKLSDNTKMDCRMVIIGKGVSPNTGLVEGTGIKVEEGIAVDDTLNAGLEGIYAAGDVARTRDIVLEESTINALWPCAVEQGRVAGLNMAGKKTAYEGSIGMNSLDFYGMPVISIGITRPKKDGYEELIKQDTTRNIYRKIVIKNNRIVGIVLVNAVKQAGVFGTLMKKKVDISAIKTRLLDDSFNFAKVLPLIAKEKEKFGEDRFRESAAEFNIRQ